MSQATIEHITADEKGVARLIGRRTKVMQFAVDSLAGMSPPRSRRLTRICRSRKFPPHWPATTIIKPRSMPRSARRPKPMNTA